MVNSITWQKEPIHRWYFLTEGLPINLVRNYLRKANGPILDPFVGAGTVLVEAKLAGIQAVGIDINPFMCFASSIKTRTYDPDSVLDAVHKVLEEISDHDPSISPPPIPNLDRYYSPRVLKKLLILKEKILRLSDIEVRRLLLLAFADIAVKASNAKKSPALRFSSIRMDYPVFSKFKKKVRIIVEDIENLTIQETPIDVILTDARDLSFLERKFNLVITSPPYCNNVDFVRHTQLELYWLGLAKSSQDLGRIRRACITSCEAMAHVNKDCTPIPHLKEVYKIAKLISKNTRRRLPHIVTQYFVGMYQHFVNLREVIKCSAKLLYVIGDSWLSGVYIPTHLLLAKLARNAGFTKCEIRTLRIRNVPRRHRHVIKEYLLIIY